MIILGTSKDRMTTFEEKCFEVACKFSTSFLQKEDTENQTITNDNQNDESLIELPPFLRDIFDWLLDHHEVESSGARLKGSNTWFTLETDWGLLILFNTLIIIK